MLELKRRLSQAVRIGTRTVVTVIAVEEEPQRAVLRIREFRTAVSVPLVPGEICEAHVDGHPLKIHLRSVERGEAVLGFDAPRELPVDRAEKPQ